MKRRVNIIMCIILFLIFLGIGIFLINKFSNKNSVEFNNIANHNAELHHYLQESEPIEFQPRYKGLCLFDIDGTLTTGENNEKVVDLCLKAGYAVGISTAGSGYTPRNLTSFSWMPQNLYKFMSEHNFITFNNVASNILAGKYDPLGYKFIKDKYFDHTVWGVLKGHSLMKTAAKYNIKDPSKMILFDNDPSFIKGVKIYNKYMQAICSGSPCGDILSPTTIINALRE